MKLSLMSFYKRAWHNHVTGEIRQQDNEEKEG